MRLPLFLLLVIAGPASAQTMVASPGPETVSVTVYRAPGRAPDDAIDRDFPEGYALVTETRRIAIPAGRATIRFEGVASGIFAESAIVSGLPDGVVEKNLDADLLSPGTLFNRSLGRRVTLRRTDRATGRVSEEQGVIRSAEGGGMILRTAAGYEAVRCSGLAEAIVYDSVPPGLTPKPTLSVETESKVAATATVTLSYLAGGFDWQANYVATMRPDGRSADLVAWVTLVSDDVTSFVDAGTQVVAGKPNREGDWDTDDTFAGYGKDAACWASGPPVPMPPAIVMPPPVMAMAPPPPAEEGSDIIVTGSRMMKQEELGDLKLYRVPQPVTVAAKAQKQVALLVKPAVPVRVVYVSDVSGDDADDPVLTLRVVNKVADGLGVPLPAGPVAVFQPAGGRDVLLGETATDDKAVGEEVEFKLADTPSVSVAAERIQRGRYELTVSNANRWPIAFEAKFRGDGKVRGDGVRLFERDGARIWAATVPANGTATLRYRIPSED